MINLVICDNKYNIFFNQINKQLHSTGLTMFWLRGDDKNNSKFYIALTKLFE